MSESTQVTDLNKTIETLNNSHTEYANYIQTSKTNLAEVITNAGVTTNGDDTFETMIANVSNILSTKTNDVLKYVSTGVQNNIWGTGTLDYTYTLNVEGDLFVIVNAVCSTKTEESAISSLTLTSSNTNSNITMLNESNNRSVSYGMSNASSVACYIIKDAKQGDVLTLSVTGWAVRLNQIIVYEY